MSTRCTKKEKNIRSLVFLIAFLITFSAYGGVGGTAEMETVVNPGQASRANAGD